MKELFHFNFGSKAMQLYILRSTRRSIQEKWGKDEQVYLIPETSREHLWSLWSAQPQNILQFLPSIKLRHIISSIWTDKK